MVLAATMCATGCAPKLSEGDAKALAEAKAFLAGGGDVNARDNSDWTRMRHAVWNNHLGTMRFLIANGTDLKEEDRCRHHLLHDAALRGRLDAMKLLIEHGADVNAKLDYTKYTALHMAAFEGSIETVRFLVQHKADINAKGRGRDTPLFFAAASGSYEVAEFLLSRGASATVSIKSGVTPLWVAAGGHWPVIREFGGEWFHIDFGDTPEEAEARLRSFHTGDHGKVIRLLARNGGRVKEVIWYNTALHRAAFAGNLSAVKVLLELGADPSIRTGAEMYDEDLCERPGYNALDAAVWAGVRWDPDQQGGRLVEMLILAGVDVNQHDGMGQTPLHHAVENLHVGAIKALLKAGADINAVDKKYVSRRVVTVEPIPPYYRHNIGYARYGQTPLFTALRIDFSRYWDKKQRSQLRANQLVVVKLLLENGADVAAKLPDGATPLHTAVLYGNRKRVVELLLKHGADVNAKDNELATPLHYAAALDWDGELDDSVRLGLVRMLLKKGASAGARTKGDKMTPGQWAWASGADDAPEGSAWRKIEHILFNAKLSQRILRSGFGGTPRSRPAPVNADR